MKKYKLLSVALITVVALTGCQNNPESSIVKNKDMDKLIEQAKATPSPNASGTPKEDLKQMEEKYDSYKTSFSDDNLKVNVNVDAKVDIPKTDKLSVLKVKQKNISQQFLDKVRKTFLGDKELYDGGATKIETKAVIEDEISTYQQYLKDIKGTVDEEVLTEEYQNHIDEYKNKYETAPDKLDVTTYKIDGKIHKVKDKLAEGKLKDYYEWQNMSTEDGEIFYGVSDGSDGWYESLYVQNNKNYSNCIRYSKAKKSYIVDTGVILVDLANLGAGQNPLCPGDEDASEFYTAHNVVNKEKSYRFVCENETVHITEEEALTKVKESFKSLGLDDFECEESGFFNETLRLVNDSTTEIDCRKSYIFHLTRTINGASILKDGDKMADGINGEAYTKKFWPKECIEVKVNDDGIVEFSYNAPLEVTETVVENSNIKTFEEIKKVFEKMVTVANAQQDIETNITVNEVKLRYERIAEKDNFDSGLLIPAWDFIGRKENGMDTSDCSILTINAVDGSIINRELGY